MFNKSLILGIVLMTVCSCAKQTTPVLVPAVEVKPASPLGVIGGVEPVYFLPMKSPFSARIDTGAETSSLDVSNLRHFERDGEKWVSFTLQNKNSGETHNFEKRVIRKVTIKRIAASEKRVTVNMDVKFGKEILNADFTLADREKFEYQVLIGRNILNGRAIVDPSISNTLN